MGKTHVSYNGIGAALEKLDELRDSLVDPEEASAAADVAKEIFAHFHGEYQLIADAMGYFGREPMSDELRERVTEVNAQVVRELLDDLRVGLVDPLKTDSPRQAALLICEYFHNDYELITEGLSYFGRDPLEGAHRERVMEAIGYVEAMSLANREREAKRHLIPGN